MLDYPALKPHDLSNTPGLVYATNMILSPGGILTDISGNGNSGSIVGAVSSKDGMVFSGGAYVQTSSVDKNIGTIHTIAFRVKDSDLSFDGAILRRNGSNDDQLLINTLRVEYRLTDVTTDLDYDFSENLWYNVVVARNGLNLSLYVNGVLGDTTALSADNDYSFDTIGSTSTGQSPLEGELADLKIFNYAFSAEESRQYHQQWAKEIHTLDRFDNEGTGSTIG